MDCCATFPAVKDLFGFISLLTTAPANGLISFAADRRRWPSAPTRDVNVSRAAVRNFCLKLQFQQGEKPRVLVQGVGKQIIRGALRAELCHAKTEPLTISRRILPPLRRGIESQ